MSVLGHGSYGEVFHARLDGPMGFQKDAALKRIHPHLVDECLDYLGIATDEGSWFLAVEYVDGVTLQQLVDASAEANQTVPPAIALEILEQLCRGLDYAHTLRDDKGGPLRVIHRDLKPANPMISRDGVVKIMDFGMAKASSNMRDSTASGMIKGTPAHMSPEQVQATTHGRRLYPDTDGDGIRDTTDPFPDDPEDDSLIEGVCDSEALATGWWCATGGSSPAGGTGLLLAAAVGLRRRRWAS